PSDRLDCTLDSDRICLLTNDGSEAGIKLAQTLTAEGWQVVLLSFPQAIVSQQLPLPSEVNSVRLADLSEKHLQQKLAAITDRYGKIGAFIHLSPINLDNTKAKVVLKGVFLLAKHLKQSLNEAATQRRSWFITVSRLDGKLGLGNNGNSKVISGGLSGLAKTLNWEWRSVFCRSLDLCPKLDTETTVNSILAELYDPNVSIAEVGYSSQGRVTLIASDYPPAWSTANIEPDSVFLVSGGGRGITAQCVIELSKYYRCQFILLGRSQLKPEPDWANNCTEVKELRKRAFSALSQPGIKPQPKEIEQLVKDILAAREIKHTLQQIEELGSTAIYLSADLTDELNLQSKLNPVISKLGKIKGLIHGAGILADKLIEYKTERDFELVYHTKVTGLQNLLDCVDLPQLKHLILFSSAAGFYGNIGQADYAIANEILNKFAYQFKQQNSLCQVVTFNWGPWDSGMVTPELKKVFARRGIELIPVEVGTQIFVQELITEHSTTAQVLVGSSLVTPASPLDSELKSYRIRRKLNLANSPILQDHTIGSNPVLPVVFVTSWLANTAEQIYPDY
ncbi:MAG: SDR family NAD(P)-dependent oxidoreductase, partial [Waterburya sp.]